MENHLMPYSSDVVRLAAKRATEQGVLADSPGTVNASGTPTLCAASCLAFAGLLLQHGEKAAEKFASHVCATGDKKYVADTFEILGWPRANCADAMMPNDAHPPKERLVWFLNTLCNQTT